MTKTGLVLEGGGMRGIYTAGVLDVFLDHNITVDGVIGVSAGPYPFEDPYIPDTPAVRFLHLYSIHKISLDSPQMHHSRICIIHSAVDHNKNQLQINFPFSAMTSSSYIPYCFGILGCIVQENGISKRYRSFDQTGRLRQGRRQHVEAGSNPV